MTQTWAMAELLTVMRNRGDSINQVNAAEVFMNGVGANLFVEITQGKCFARVPKETYLLKLNIRAEEDLAASDDADLIPLTHLSFELSKYVEGYKRCEKFEIKESIKKFLPGIQKMLISPKNCSILRNFIDRECPFFTVEFGTNFVGKPHFVFLYYDLDMYGESV